MGTEPEAAPKKQSLALEVYTIIHTVISLVGIATGLVVLGGLLVGNPLNGWTLVFLVTTVLTSVTGFGFPFERFLPSHAFGIVSLVVLAVAILGRYTFHMAGPWRWIYVVSAMIALYLNVFVGVVQAFQKIPALKATAPTQSERPFVIAQLVVLVVFLALTIYAAMAFHIEPVPAA